MPTLRIRGLVRAMNYVRERMERGVERSKVDALRTYISTVVAAVERICREHRARPSDLPRPSRQAYDYLAHLAATQTVPPVRSSGQRRSGPRVPNVVRTANTLLTTISTHLDQEPAASAVANVAQATREAAVRVEHACARQGHTPAHLPPPSRRAYAMLAFLSNEGVLLRYRETVRALRRLCEASLSGASPKLERLVVRLDDQAGIYRYQRRSNEWLLRLNPGFITAERDVLEAVVREVREGKRKDRRGVIHEFVHSEEFASVGQELDDIVAGEPQTEGAAYDLAEVCEHVRHRHFDPPVALPASLAWTDGLTFHTFGHYNSLRDRITISRSLDDRRIPRYVIEFVMYHELLHKFHGIGWATSRRAMHTPAFRADEKRFPRYERAQEFLNRLAVRLRRRLR